MMHSGIATPIPASKATMTCPDICAVEFLASSVGWYVVWKCGTSTAKGDFKLVAEAGGVGAVGASHVAEMLWKCLAIVARTSTHSNECVRCLRQKHYWESMF